VRRDKGLSKKWKANLDEMKSVAKNRAACNEEATVDTTETWEDQYGDQHLAVGYCQQLRKWTKGGGGSQQKMAATHRGMICHASPALCKRHGHEGPGKDNVVQGTQKG
jgi:hypothetical protein